MKKSVHCEGDVKSGMKKEGENGVEEEKGWYGSTWSNELANWSTIGARIGSGSPRIEEGVAQSAPLLSIPVLQRWESTLFLSILLPNTQGSLASNPRSTPDSLSILVPRAALSSFLSTSAQPKSLNHSSLPQPSKLSTLFESWPKPPFLVATSQCYTESFLPHRHCLSLSSSLFLIFCPTISTPTEFFFMHWICFIHMFTTKSFIQLEF